MPASILIVEDTESLALLYQSYLIPTGLKTFVAGTGQAALDYLDANQPDLIILDIMLPDMSGMDILAQLPEQNRPDVIVLTAHASKELAVEAIRHGAIDFLEKPIDAERFRITVNNGLKLKTLSKKVEEYQSTFENGRFCQLIGKSSAMQSVYQIISNAANSKATVFITGESGTGKELCAKAVHECSDRKQAPFVALNCAAIPKDLIESEIFGHVKGAFTGATSNREGAAGQADGGTLFLDELCEMDLGLQSKLLRFIQTGTFQKVGSETLQTVNVRFVCATNRDPWLEVQEGRFREDLYYRLYVIPIQLPPLRDRGEDVVQIAQAMFERIAKEEGKFFEKLTENAKQKLLNYDWPGNVRQLENMIRNTLVMNHSEVIDAHMFPAFPVSNSNVQQIAPPNQANALSTPNPSFDEVQTGSAVTTANEPVATMQSHFDIRPMWIVEKEYIEQAIEICGNNIPKAAAMLELSPSTIYRKMKTWEQ
ncbi:MAG: sigma-54-dependent Fis family transcriptional regulator [Pseudoalteromonas sp.]|nr:sigma-54-dependent Fis family transcriptional regulator [Pseudoalteromonas sp.]|tara:strand:- start:621 stop:2066 length:1446 start_codon:yes stop_codon:yes gene_type:complete